MTLTDQQYEKERTKGEVLYTTLKPVKCKAIEGEMVHFTSEGFNHIVYKRKKKERGKGDQVMRFRCLDLARKILECTTTLQEKDLQHVETVVKTKKKRHKVMRPVRFWGFIAIMHNKKVKVIVKKIGEGKIVFWSVIPFWQTTKHGDVVYRDFVTGDLEQD